MNTSSRTSNTTEREIARKLQPASRPQPPADLLGKIRAEIPERLDLPAPGTTTGRGSGWATAPWLRIAAAVVVIAGAGWIALRLQTDRRPTLETAASREEVPQEVAAKPAPPTVAQIADQAATQERANQATAPIPVDRLETDEKPKAMRSLAASGGPSPPAAKRQAPERQVPEAKFYADLPSAESALTLGLPVSATETVGEIESPAETERPVAPETRARAPRPISAPRPVIDDFQQHQEAIEALVREQSRLKAEMAKIQTGVAAPANPRALTPLRSEPTATAAAVASPGITATATNVADEPRVQTAAPAPWADPREDRLSTFGLDVDTGSYTIGRRHLEQGQLPPTSTVRVEEWLNAFDYGDPPPRDGDFALRLEGAPSPFADGRHLLRIGLRARDVAAASRPPADLVFLVDVSGSMDEDDRLPLVKRALRMLAGQLRPDDTVGLVVYGNDGRVVLEPTSDRERLREAIDSLVPEGSTNLEAGLWLAYEMAARRRGTDRLRRVILCSDGVANVGRTDPENLLRRIADFASSGIELTTIGFGMGEYNDALMERLADRGDGRYAYVDDLAEARRVLVENLTGTLLTVASDARIQVDFDPETVVRYRLIGYHNRALPDQAFRDPRTDAGEVGAGHSVTALYEVELRGASSTPRPFAKATLRYRSKANGDFAERSAEIRRTDLTASWRRATPSLQLAAVVAELAESLASVVPVNSGPARIADRLDRAFREGQRLMERFPGRSDVAELVALAGRARDLAAAAGR